MHSEESISPTRRCLFFECKTVNGKQNRVLENSKTHSLYLMKKERQGSLSQEGTHQNKPLLKSSPPFFLTCYPQPTDPLTTTLKCGFPVIIPHLLVQNHPVRSFFGNRSVQIQMKLSLLNRVMRYFFINMNEQPSINKHERKRNPMHEKH